jgi:hypothetical protein
MSYEDELIQREAAARGISETMLRMLKATPDSLMRDLMADARKGISSSASMIPDRERKQPPVAKGSGWVEPRPLSQPPGIDKIDAMCIEQGRRERLVKIHERLAELQRLEEIERRRRDRELDPVNCGLYDK